MVILNAYGRKKMGANTVHRTISEIAGGRHVHENHQARRTRARLEAKFRYLANTRPTTATTSLLAGSTSPPCRGLRAHSQRACNHTPGLDLR